MIELFETNYVATVSVTKFQNEMRNRNHLQTQELLHLQRTIVLDLYV